jgi:hypothetical protein
MPVTRTLPLALLALFAFGCSRSAHNPPASDVEHQLAGTPVEAFFLYGPVELATSRAQLRERLGAPDSVLQRVLPNPHDPGVIDTVFTVHHPGLAVEIYRASFDGRELLASLSIADDRWLRAESPLRLGMSRDAIRLALGEPEHEEDGDLFFTCTTCTVGGQDGLELRMDGGRLSRIRVQYWID